MRSLLLVPALWLAAGSRPGLAQEPLPVDATALGRLVELSTRGIQNCFSPAQLDAALAGGPGGLVLDLSSATRLLDGTVIEPSKVYGKARWGPYPFAAGSARFPYARFARSSPVEGGKAELKVGRLLDPIANSEGWTDRGTLAVRLELFLEQPGQDRALGVYDLTPAFQRADQGFRRLPWLSEGPFVELVDSRRPGEAVVAFELDGDAPASVVLDNRMIAVSAAGRRQRIRLSGLTPGATYTYKVRVGDLESRAYQLKAAPLAGRGPVAFVYCGDSREGQGGGLEGYMGVNRRSMERLSDLAFLRGADFLLMEGDFSNGHTSSREDLLAQWHAWKQSAAGYWAQSPVYAAMGNHEVVVRAYDSGKKFPLALDRWPYGTESAEALFAGAFDNPQDGPEARPGLPPYRGSVFTVQYGPVRIISLNNTYWYSDAPDEAGGSPDGFIFEDQLSWLEEQLAAADKDASVRYVLVAAHSPAFPCSGHVDSAMWYDGDNKIRAHVFSGGKLVPAEHGVVEMRNRLARAVASSKKVAAVLGSDEHAYHRVLIDGRVPAGDPAVDDKDRDGRIAWDKGEPASPLAGLPRGVWYLTSGGAGAPYYAEKPAPWADYWRARPDKAKGYFFTSRENLLLFRADDRRLSVTVLDLDGEVIDQVPDLMKSAQRP